MWPLASQHCCLPGFSRGPSTADDATHVRRNVRGDKSPHTWVCLSYRNANFPSRVLYNGRTAHLAWNLSGSVAPSATERKVRDASAEG